MKLSLENVDSKHYAWLCQMAKALNFTITNIEINIDESVDTSLEESETSYLLSTDANKKHLEESLQQAEKRKTKQVDISKLWK